MLKLATTGQFRKDYKRLKNRGYDMSLLETVINILLSETPLDKKYLDHKLTGNYAGFQECHILPDWILIYATNNNALILTASRTGTHADIYKK